MSLISQFDLINKKTFLFINTAVYKYKLQFVYDRKIYQFTARNVYKTIFNLKDLIDKKQQQ